MITINGKPVKSGYFNDGTFKLSFPEPDVTPEDVIFWKYENITEQLLLYNLTKHLREHGSEYITLVMPYVPNARMDRAENYTDCFTLKYFAEFINDLAFNRVCILDPHSNVTSALLDRVQVLTPEIYIKAIIDKMDVDIVCYPDYGAYKRYNKLVSNNFGKIHQLYCIKTRDWDTGIITGMTLNIPTTEKMYGKNILIIDDICGTGNTIHLCSKKLKELKPRNIYAFTTHCENSIMSGPLLSDDSCIDEIFTTDSLAHEDHDKIYTIPIQFDLHSSSLH